MNTINKKNVPNRCWTYLCSVHNVWVCFAWKWLNLIPWLTTPIEAYHGLRFLLPINYNVCIEGLKPTARWSYCACFSSSSFEVNFQSCPFYSTHGEVSKLPVSGSITKYDYSILLFCFGIEDHCKVKSCTFTPWLRQKTWVIRGWSALETGKL